jgi:Entner-Doudoroff aldolase
MNQKEFMDALAETKVCPVVVIDHVEDAVPLAKALEAGKLPMAEVTFRTDAAADAIRTIAKECPNVIVGAGTVLDREQCARAIDAGAQFIVAPSFSDEVAQCAVGHGVAYCPGTCTPTDITAALRYNLPMVKFFPAAAYGGLKTIKALSSVFPQLKFMPTGGVNKDNVLEYLGFDKIIAVGGTWVCKKNLVNDKNWDEITRLCREAYDLTHQN